MPRNFDFSRFYKCLKMATLWLALMPFMSEEVIWGTGCGRLRWNEKGKSPIVLVFGPGMPLGGGCGTLIEVPLVFISFDILSLTLP